MQSDFAKLHISILIAGLTGVFGKLIHLPEGPLVCYRILFTCVLLCGYFRISGKLPRVAGREMLRIGGAGVLLTLHWIFFYASIKYANVSIGVICFSVTGFFTAFFDPLITRRKISAREVAFSLVAVCGIMLVFHLDTRYRLGIVLGIVAAALAALFTIVNKRVGRKHASTTMLFYEMLGGLTVLTLLAPLYLTAFPETKLVPSPMDAAYLLALSSLCTVGLYLLQIQALRSISPFTVNLSYNLEPVYSIAIAMAFLGEAGELNWPFYLGLGLICPSVALQTRSAFRERREPPTSGRHI